MLCAARLGKGSKRGWGPWRKVGLEGSGRCSLAVTGKEQQQLKLLLTFGSFNYFKRRI